MGSVLLGLWLILTALTTLAHVSVPAPWLAVLALVAGILVLVGR